MSTTLTAVAKFTLSWDFQNVLDLATVPDKAKFSETQTLANGTSDDQANDMFHDRRYLTSGSPNDDIDLAGVLTNVFGQTLIFTKIRQIIVLNKGVPDATHESWTETSGEYITIGGAASNPFTALFDGDADATIKIPSGGLFVATAPVDGWTVTAGSADTLRVAKGGSSDVDYDIVIVGTDSGGSS